MSNELVTRGNALQISNVDDLARVSEMFAKSGYFNDAREAAQAGVKILAGQGWGIAPFDAMTGVHIIQGRAAIGAHLIAAKIKASGKYDYRVRTMTDKACEIEFFQGGQPIGVSTFTLEDAKKAGTKNLDKFARNMLFARAMSNGYRWYCPDVFTGPVYTPEELGASVDGEGNVVEVQAAPRKALEPGKAKAALEAAADVAEEALEEMVDEVVADAGGEFPPEPEQPLFDADGIKPAHVTAIGAAMKPLKLSKDQARLLVESVVERSITTIKDLTAVEGEDLAAFTTDQWTLALDSLREPA